MASVDVAAYRRAYRHSRLALFEGQPLNSSHKPSERWQWRCHDNSTINMYVYILFISGIKPIERHTYKLTKRTELIVTTNKNGTYT